MWKEWNSWRWQERFFISCPVIRCCFVSVTDLRLDSHCPFTSTLQKCKKPALLTGKLPLQFTVVSLSKKKASTCTLKSVLLPWVASAPRACVVVAIHLQQCLTLIVTVGPWKANPSTCCMCSNLKKKKSQKRVKTPPSQEISLPWEFNFQQLASFLLKWRVIRTGRTHEKYNKAFKGLETWFALTIFII